MSLAALMAVVVLAFVTEAAVGFGSTVLVVSLGAHLRPVDELLAAFVPLNALLSVFILARTPRAVEALWLARRVLPAVAVGVVAGMLAFRALRGAGALLPVLGACVTALAAWELARGLRGRGTGAPLGRWAGAALLALGGVVHGMFGSGGPLVVYVASREVTDKTRFRATLAALWLTLNVVLVTNYAAAGMLTRERATTSAALLPALVAGALLGDRVHGRVDARRFRSMTYAVLLAAGLALLARSAR